MSYRIVIENLQVIVQMRFILIRKKVCWNYRKNVVILCKRDLHTISIMPNAREDL